jgi:DNA-binding GntR family transcriptional regulator
MESGRVRHSKAGTASNVLPSDVALSAIRDGVVPDDLGARWSSAGSETESAAEAAIRILRRAILEGVLRPGVRLRQDELASQIGTSRIPLRDALRHLQSEGLVKIDGRRGARVVALGIDDIREIYEMRILLEGHLTRLAVEALDDEAAQRLIDLSNTMHDVPNGGAASRSRVAFYAELYRYADRDRMRELVLRLRADVHRYHMLTDVAASLDSHADLRDLLANRDAEGAALEVGRHLAKARDELIEALAAEAERIRARPARGKRGSR